MGMQARNGQTYNPSQHTLRPCMAIKMFSLPPSPFQAMLLLEQLFIHLNCTSTETTLLVGGRGAILTFSDHQSHDFREGL